MFGWQPQDAAARFASQWKNPKDALTILLIIGGDIVQKAIAQLCGEVFVPVAFSFGWVSYSFNALLSVYGDGTLMPVVTNPSIIFNSRSGHARQNYSWMLNRLLRGVECSLEPLDAALCVSVFRAKEHRCRGSRDWVWWSGLLTIVLQICIATVPCITESDWTSLLVSVLGIGLALAGGALPQWRREKWGSRLLDNNNTTFCLTRGNGFQHVVVIQNQGPKCLNFEKMAIPSRQGSTRSAKAVATVLAVLWIIFLINTASLPNNTWYLVGIGFIGMIQNIFAAATPRRPEAMGIPLELVARLQGPKVMSVLMRTEDQFPSVGFALVRTFFPGDLSSEEEAYWTRKEEAIRPLFRGSTLRADTPGSPLPAPTIGHVSASQLPNFGTYQSATTATVFPFAPVIPPPSSPQGCSTPNRRRSV